MKLDQRLDQMYNGARRLPHLIRVNGVWWSISWPVNAHRVDPPGMG